ncbi:Scr1 family TA system antitoxin-like transcriptional regulator [Streptomyces sp. NPDC059454]|uniref:Scr1 family TA system antitoxin-like transcriptional regulator n=1 Tax=Streptomyces sp. NPDC059454 TaxID=3346836 RepID=UPI00367DCA99
MGDAVKAAAPDRGRLLPVERKPPVGFRFVVHEAALHSPQADVDQLRHLLEVSRLRNVVLQVLPFDRAVPVALMGPMVLLETRDHERFVVAEGPLVSGLSADPGVVGLATERLGVIRTQALSPAESARSVERMVDRHE